MRSELQKAALEALIEVRREMLNRAFASGTMKMSEELGKTMALERQMEEQQVGERVGVGVGVGVAFDTPPRHVTWRKNT